MILKKKKYSLKEKWKVSFEKINVAKQIQLEIFEGKFEKFINHLMISPRNQQFWLQKDLEKFEMQSAHKSGIENHHNYETVLTVIHFYNKLFVYNTW